MSGGRIESAQMLDELAETGYTGTELGDWGFMPTDPAVLQAELRKRALTLTGAFVPVRLIDADSQADGEMRTVRVARLLEAAAVANAVPHQPFIVLADDNGSVPERVQRAGRITPDMLLSTAQWSVAAACANRIARAVRDATGLPLVFHHHCAGYIETPEEIARFLELTDPDLVGLVFDTGHYAYGSGDNAPEAVLEGFDRFAGRIRYIHFKDCDPQIAARARAEGWDYFTAIKHGLFCELGRGLVPFAEVTARLRERNYQNWITVEQDVLPGMGVPRESAQRNRDYLRGIGL
jgi:inosose dehydratase